MDLQTYLADSRHIIDTALDRYLPPEDRPPITISRAMRYSVMQGGKRLRPILTLAGCEAVGGDQARALPTVCAIELIHAFSLIHDDLPALDNDDFRRGKPTSHKVFGEAVAILAGDALLALAFDVISGQTTGIPAGTVLRVLNRLAAATGWAGMIGGQVVDMESEGKQVGIDELRSIHSRKTGMLIQAAVVCGGMLGDASEAQLDALTTYGARTGLAFQITDDILDLVGDSERLGKTAGSDLRKRKATYPALLGPEKSRELAQISLTEALDALHDFDHRADPLRAIARFVVERES